MTKRHDEFDLGIRLSRRHDRVGGAPPARPGCVGVRLGIRDETNGAGVEPAPVLATTPLARRSGGAMSIRYREASFVVAQVVARGVPLMVPPGRHVSGRPAPD